MKASILIAVVGLLAGGGAAVDASTGPDAATDASLWDRTFRSISISENGQPRELAPGTRIRLVLHNGGLHAHAGCAEIQGSAEIQGGAGPDAAVLVVTGIDVWRGACVDDGWFEQDLWLAAFLDSDPSLLLDGHDLVLATADAQLRLTDDRAVATDPVLRDTYWVIESIVDGSGSIAVPAFPQPYFMIGAEGLHAYDGCNWLSGAAGVDADTITFSGIGTTKRACADQDLLVAIKIFDALHNGEVSFRIEAGRLALSRPDGPGLLLRSQA